jgi:transcriptional regulator with XRE-family HTH domain
MLSEQVPWVNKVVSHLEGDGVTRLKYMRLMKEWSLDKLGQEAGLGGSDLSKIERGRLVPYPPQLERLSKALGIPAERLMEEVAYEAHETAKVS